MAVFGQKLLYSGKVVVIGQFFLVCGQSCCFLEKVVLLEKN